MKSRSERHRLVVSVGLFAALAAAGVGCGADAAPGGPDEVTLDTGAAPQPLPAASAPTAQMLSILDEREGYGQWTYGGQYGTVYHVTTTANSGPGSLRQALESDEDLWIVFDVEGTITLSDKVRLKSYKTVDARGKYIRIKTDDWQETAFIMDGVNNVILINLEFDNDWPDYDDDVSPEGADAITIRDSYDIWIHHCEFLEWADGAIDIKEYSGGEFKGDVEWVSVTWSRFRKVYQALLWEGDRLSLGHNVASPSVGTRFPKIIADGATPSRVHSYNNYIAGWAGSNIQFAKGGGELYSQYNIYESGSQTKVNARETGGKIRNDAPHKIGTVNFQGGSDSVDSGFVSEATGYADVDSCSTSACWTALKNRLLNGDAIHAAAGTSL